MQRGQNKSVRHKKGEPISAKTPAQSAKKHRKERAQSTESRGDDSICAEGVRCKKDLGVT